MITGPRYKICKRLGNGVFEKCQTQKYAVSESRRGMGSRGRRPRQLSDYGKQLLEKQRVRFTYGISEKQLSGYVQKAVLKQKDPVTKLRQLLEMRLDNIVFRLGLAPTRRAARQAVSHGHIKVNGGKVTIPSYQTKVGDSVTIRDKSKESPLFTELEERHMESTSPKWLLFNPKKIEGIIKSLPGVDDAETSYDLTIVMEFYSR
jgi:small subunit ribosomal protein S4